VFEVLVHLVDVLRTNLHALSAIDADSMLHHYLYFTMYPFRVCAPLAAKRATLKKYECADTWAIEYIVFLYIENQGFSFKYAV